MKINIPKFGDPPTNVEFVIEGENFENQLNKRSKPYVVLRKTVLDDLKIKVDEVVFKSVDVTLVNDKEIKAHFSFTSGFIPGTYQLLVIRQDGSAAGIAKQVVVAVLLD